MKKLLGLGLNQRVPLPPAKGFLIKIYLVVALLGAAWRFTMKWSAARVPLGGPAPETEPETTG